MVTLHLPAQFADLDDMAVEWALPTQTSRLEKRLSSSMEEIREFYDRLVPRLEQMLDYLDQFPLQAMPADAQHLLNLAFAAAMLAPAVEMFKQPAVVCGFDPRNFLPTHEPTSTRPVMSYAPKAFV